MSESKKTLGGRLSSATRQQQAIRLDREDKKTENPVVAMLAGAARKLLGIALLFVGHGILGRTEAMTGVPQLVYIGIALAVGCFGLFCLMPDVTMTFLRFFGLGGLVDKVLKRKAES